jgi:ATP-binding cassette subfamily F protein 3
MASITVQDVTKEFGPQVVLRNLSLEIHPGETVGLIGANGSGKTTLFRLMAGELPPDVGTVTRSKGLKIGYLKQEPEIGEGHTLHDEVGSVFADLLALEHRLHALSDEMAARHDEPALPELMAEYERINERFITAGGYSFEARLNEILGGLGFSQADYEMPMSLLSGGQKCRAALAKLLLREHQLLLLDEPTNHLDIDAVRWLEKFLAGHHGGAVIVSHDRYLLDRLVDRVIELENGAAHSYPGNYSNYAQSKEVRLLTQKREYVKDTAFIRKERAFIAKHMGKQRTREAKGRRTRLQRRIAGGEFVTEKPTANRRAKLSFGDSRQKDSQTDRTPMLRCDELAMAFGDNRLFSGLNFQVREGDRFGITGPNGTGKTTLLRIILGQIEPVAGEVTRDLKLRVGYYDQEHAGLDPNVTVVDEVRGVREGMSELEARSHLARFLITGDDVFKSLGQLSGGEQSRVRLAKLILTAPEVLILDEPTNHLDIPSREALEEALVQFAGTIIAVSHDRYFLDRIVERLLVIRPREHGLYTGNYSSYLAQVEEKDSNQPASPAPHTKKTAKRKLQASRRRKAKAKKTREKRAETEGPKREGPRYDHLSVQRIEEMIIERETELGLLHDKFGDPAILRDPDALDDLRDRVDELTHELSELEAAWEDRADAV